MSKTEVRFVYEETQAASLSRLGGELQAAALLARSDPFLFASTAFGSAAGLPATLESLAAEPKPSGEPSVATKRLRAIEVEGEERLSLTYDPLGRLASVAYFDGVTARYEFDASGRPKRVDLGSEGRTEFSYASDHTVNRIDYPVGLSFAYGSDSLGRTVRTEFPDGVASRRSYDEAGQLARVEFADMTLRVEGSGLGATTSVESGPATFPLDEAGLAEGLELHAIRSDAKGTVLLGAAGRWVLDVDGRPNEIIGPDGSRACIHRVPGPEGSDRQAHFWTDRGQEVVHYDTSGRPCSAIHADGSRTAFFALADGSRRIALHPSGIRIMTYHPDARLLSVRTVSGEYAILDYDPHSRLSRIRSNTGTTKARRDRSGRLDRIGLPSGAGARLDYGGRAYPNAIRFARRGPYPLETVGEFLAAYWLLNGGSAAHS